MNLTPSYNCWSVPPKLWLINVPKKLEVSQFTRFGKALCLLPVTTLLSHGEERGSKEPECYLGFLVDFVLPFQDIWKSCLKKSSFRISFLQFCYLGVYS